MKASEVIEIVHEIDNNKEEIRKLDNLLRSLGGASYTIQFHTANVAFISIDENEKLHFNLMDGIKLKIQEIERQILFLKKKLGE